MKSKCTSVIVIVAAALVLGITGNANALVTDFGDLTNGTTYNVGDSFSSYGVTFSFEDFYYTAGGPATTTGQAVVDTLGTAGGADEELGLYAINARLNFTSHSDGLSLQFGESGTVFNIDINGETVVFDNFASINNTSIGGTTVFTMNFGGQGAVFVIGEINTFAIGGDNLVVDNIIYSIPEPATIAMLGLGISMVVRRKRKQK